MNNTELRKRLIEVFTKWVEETDCLAILRNDLDDLLDSWHSDDAFGTEGQNDPRGDARDLDRFPRI